MHSHLDPKQAFGIEQGLPQAFQCILGKIWHTCFQMCPAQLFPMMKSKLGAGSFALTLFRQSGFSAIRLFHSLDMLSQWDSLLLHFAIEWLHHHEHVWAIIQLTLISTYCRLVTQYQAFRISSWPVWACMENLAWKGKWGEQDTGKVLKSLSGDLITCGQHCF